MNVMKEHFLYLTPFGTPWHWLTNEVSSIHTGRNLNVQISSELAGKDHNAAPSRHRGVCKSTLLTTSTVGKGIYTAAGKPSVIIMFLPVALLVLIAFSPVPLSLQVVKRSHRTYDRNNKCADPGVLTNSQEWQEKIYQQLLGGLQLHVGRI